MNLLLGLATSIHMGFEGEYNQIHPHARLEYRDYAAGTYLNSENRLSSYLSYTVDIGTYYLEFGAVGGYSDSILPLVRGGKQLSNDVRFFITPGFEVGGTNKPKVVLGLEFNLRK